jgi:hypothetical protein
MKLEKKHGNWGIGFFFNSCKMFMAANKKIGKDNYWFNLYL